jgi:hypothetical protein
MKYSFITFSNEKYEKKQQELINYVKFMHNKGSSLFANIIGYNANWLKKTDFYKSNKLILDMERGAGFWLWKPFIILETLKNINDGDIVFYIDCGDTFYKDLISYTSPILEKENCLLLGGSYIQKDWTKADCFYYMNCTGDEYKNTLQLEAGVQLWKKTSSSIKILEEQIKWCSDYRILTDSQNESGMANDPGFKDHRHDQSVLTNLMVKYSLPVDTFRASSPYSRMRDYVKCNV